MHKLRRLTTNRYQLQLLRYQLLLRHFLHRPINHLTLPNFLNYLLCPLLYPRYEILHVSLPFNPLFLLIQLNLLESLLHFPLVQITLIYYHLLRLCNPYTIVLDHPLKLIQSLQLTTQLHQLVLTHLEGLIKGNVLLHSARVESKCVVYLRDVPQECFTPPRYLLWYGTQHHFILLLTLLPHLCLDPLQINTIQRKLTHLLILIYGLQCQWPIPQILLQYAVGEVQTTIPYTPTLQIYPHQRHPTLLHKLMPQLNNCTQPTFVLLIQHCNLHILRQEVFKVEPRWSLLLHLNMLTRQHLTLRNEQPMLLHNEFSRVSAILLQHRLYIPQVRHKYHLTIPNAPHDLDSADEGEGIPRSVPLHVVAHDVDQLPQTVLHNPLLQVKSHQISVLYQPVHLVLKLLHLRQVSVVQGFILTINQILLLPPPQLTPTYCVLQLLIHLFICLLYAVDEVLCPRPHRLPKLCYRQGFEQLHVVRHPPRVTNCATVQEVEVLANYWVLGKQGFSNVETSQLEILLPQGVLPMPHHFAEEVFAKELYTLHLGIDGNLVHELGLGVEGGVILGVVGYAAQRHRKVLLLTPILILYDVEAVGRNTSIHVTELLMQLLSLFQQRNVLEELLVLQGFIA